MLSKHAGWVAVLAALPLLYAAPDKPFVTPLLPAADWHLVQSQPLPVSVVRDYGGEPAVDQEYGVKRVELHTYQLGTTQAKALVEPTPDATSAYGLLTFYQSPQMSPIKDVELAAGDSSQTLMARGENFIRFLRGSTSSISDADFRALLIYVGGTKPSLSTLQTLPRPLPQKGLVPGSEKYLLGLEAAKRVLTSFRTDLIGFDQGAEVQMGQYKSDTGTSTLLSISYPTPQIARMRYGSLTDLLQLNRDQGARSIYGRRQGSYLFLVLSAGNSQTAAALMNDFQVTQSVSWDQKYNSERTFTLQLIHMILAILELAALLVAACVLAGILFFLSKRFAAKFFPGSQWGRADEEQLIRLNLKVE